MTDINFALKIIKTPPTILVRGKNVSPEIFFSKELALPLAYWYSASLSEKMFGESTQWGNIKSNPTHLIGMAVEKETIDNASQHIRSLGSASALLIMAESVNQILQPATSSPNFDYGNFLINFRDAVDYHYESGEIVTLGDVDLHKIIYNDLFRPKPSQGGSGVNNKLQTGKF